MAFDLLSTNLSGVAVIDAPAGVIAGPSNFITLSSYADKYVPKLKPKLHMANGKGKITQLLSIMGQEEVYANDRIQWAEEGRLMGIIKNVARTTNTFTSPAPHNLRVNDIVKISDGTIEAQATVTTITSSTVFVATNDAGVAFAFSGNVDVICNFSNSWGKETDNFTEGRKWDPIVKENFSHIIKEVYKTSASDMVHQTWLETPDGPKWFNHEIERTSTLFDNIVELTHTFFERKASGTARGMKGILSQIEAGGNIANEYITDIEELSEIAFRIKQQGTGCIEYTIWHNHQQGAYLRQMAASVNADYAGGSYYGMFKNDKEMALKLGFNSIYIDGITFHFSPWTLLDDPTLMGNAKFQATNLACLIIPSGMKFVQDAQGNTVSKPYLSIQYRGDASYNRKREVKIFGPGGTPQTNDSQRTEFLSEASNMLIGANAYFAVRTGAGFYS